MTRATSYAPIAVAGGIMLVLWGVASVRLLSVAGLIVAGFGVIRWIGDCRGK